MIKKLLNRRSEKILLFLSIIISFFGFYLLYLAHPPENKMFIYFPFIILTLYWVIHFILCFTNPDADQIVFPVISFLSGLGIIMIYRLNPSLGFKQFIWFLISIISQSAVILLIRKNNFLKRYTYLWAVIAIFLLFITIIAGTEVNGAKLWLFLGPVRIQPVEIVKFMLVLFLANYLSQYHSLLISRSAIPGWWRVNIRYFFPLIIIWGISLLILIFQRDLGMALLLFGIFITMFYVGTGRADYCLAGIILFCIGAVGCYHMFSHLQIRVLAWLNPWKDMGGYGYQITQGLMAIGAGGMWGKGIGLGQASCIPAVETDFIFSAISEELGLLGTIAIIICYMILIQRGLRVALHSKDPFHKMLIFGITSVFAIQTWVILGGVMKLIPLTGITLPFVSYGGSSLLSNYIAIGIFLGLPEERNE